jgi:hypothetical protein
MTIWSILRPLEIFYGHLVYFTAIVNILYPFGIFYGNLVYFPTFWYFGPRKIWQPCLQCYLKRCLPTILKEIGLSAYAQGLPDFPWNGRYVYQNGKNIPIDHKRLAK